MQCDRIKLVFFSPTGTSGALGRAIAQGFGAREVQVVDITTPRGREAVVEVEPDELLVVCVPVYMGRVPALIEPWLGTLRLRGAPVVCVVVYGNRAYENALLELVDTLAGQGGVPVAGGAYIGEHSFSTPGLPTAHGRPDRDDLTHARGFGADIRRKLNALPSASKADALRVPGVRPYGGVTQLWDVDFIEVSGECDQCGHCAEVCPAGAIDQKDSAVIDTRACITCCACIKRCPARARSMRPGPVLDAATRLNGLYAERRTPGTFL